MKLPTKYKIWILVLLLSYSSDSLGNLLVVSNVSFNNTTNDLSFDLAWENSFNISGSSQFLDAAYVFVKYAPNGGDTWLHADIIDSIPTPGYYMNITYDDLGVFVHPVATGTGMTNATQTFTVTLGALQGGYQDFKVFAMEMVFIDEGDFNAGDGTSSGRFYANGDNTMPWNVTSEGAIMRGNSSGEFNQEGSSSTNNLSDGFPKGYQSIFAMKYKITAEQYVDFLNCLTRQQQESRVQSNITGTSVSNIYVMTNTSTMVDRNPIVCPTNIGTGSIKFGCDYNSDNIWNGVLDGQNIVLNHITPSDILAFFDWSGLRPISELEYEKICRGANMPAVSGEYAWGTDTYNAIGSITNAGSSSERTSNVGVLPSLYNVRPLRAGYSATSSSGRTESGGTYWGVMDIHNLGEYMYGVESTGFIRGSFGDGNLNPFGVAINSNWTVGAQLLLSVNTTGTNITPISEGKTVINPVTRSAVMGARGVRRILQPN